MTVSEKTTAARNSYTGNGVKTVFNFTFETLAISNSLLSKNYALKVILEENDVETEQVEDTDYTVQYNADTRLGTITFTTAPTSTQTITILSEIPLSQETNYISIGTDKFPAASHEGALDKLTLITTELDEKIDRSILLPESSNLTNVTIPVSTASANKAIVVNSTGDDLTTASLIDINTYPITAFAETLLDDTTAAQARTTLDAQEDVITTRGDIIRGSSAGVAERLALGSSNQVLTSDGTDITWGNNQATTTALGRSLLPNQITISNGTDTDHDIDFTAGVFQFSGGDGQAVASALTKQIDVTWAAGDAAGGLASGVSLSNDTWYYCFALSSADGTTTDFGFDTSLTAANLLADSAVIAAGLTKYKKVGNILTNGSANIEQGKWTEKGYFEFTTPILDSTTVFTTSEASVTLSIPPVDVLAKISVNVSETGTNVQTNTLIQGNWKGTVGTPSFNNSNISTGNHAGTVGQPKKNSVEMELLVDDSIIKNKSDQTLNGTAIRTLGYKDLTL